MLKFLFVCFFIFGLSSCLSHKHNNHLDIVNKKIELAPSSDYINIQKIRLNASKNTYNFIFDTGSNINVIDASFAKNMGFKTVGLKMVSDAYGKKRIKNLIKIDSLFLQGIPIYNLKAIALDLHHNDNCIDFHGIFGNTFLQKFNWYVNKKDGIIIINPTDSIKNNLDNKQPFKYKKKLPYISGNIRDKKFNFLFDTGSFDCNIKYHYENLFSNDSVMVYDFIWRSPNSKYRSNDSRLNFPNEKIHLNNTEFIRFIRVGNYQKQSIGWNFFDNGEFYIDYNSKQISYKNPINSKHNFKSRIYFNRNESDSIIISGLFYDLNNNLSSLKLNDIVLSINDFDLYKDSSSICEKIYQLNNLNSIKSLKVIRQKDILDITIDKAHP